MFGFSMGLGQLRRSFVMMISSKEPNQLTFRIFPSRICFLSLNKRHRRRKIIFLSL